MRNRLVLIPVFVAMLFMLGGCSIITLVPPGPGGPTSALTDWSSAATKTAITAMVSPEDRPEVARRIWEIAYAIRVVTSTESENSIDLSGVNLVVQTEISKWNSPYKYVVSSLFTLVLAGVQSEIDAKWQNVTESERAKIIVSLIREMAIGVEIGALAFTEGIPDVDATVQKSNATLKSVRGGERECVVRHFEWRGKKK